jgi:DNA polymerase III delta subunit
MLSLLAEYAKTEVPEIIFAMIVRQFRLMLNPLDLAPWQLARIKSQASHFSPQKLKQIYKDLLRLDYEQKSGLAPLDLKGSLELFLLAL